MKTPTTGDTAKKRMKKQTQTVVEPTFDNPVPILPRRRVCVLLRGMTRRPYRLRYAQFSIGDSVRFVLPGRSGGEA